jgi:hypothetical protein
LFESWIQNKETKAAIESEKRQIALAREQASMQATNNDAVFAQEQNNKSDLIRWQQELDNSLVILKHRLKCETKDPNTGIWVSMDKVPPLLSDNGIAMVETELSPFLGEEAKNLINSNLTELMILQTLKNTSDTIVCNLADNYDTFVLDATPSKMSHIMRIIKNAMLPTPFRAQDGWTKKQDNMGIKRIETFVDNESNNQRKKWMGVI